ncbi:MAG: 5-oxoprolinase/urea amidolyase family protein, partial [Pseudomonadales bacterium]|nr:5-oxoprolinase/urea amidolyase family protein [Pseudomonadales bacterium]
MQVRLYAEDPGKNFQPSSGLLTHVDFSGSASYLRVDSWSESGMTVPAAYDPMLAKIIVYEDNRAAATGRLIEYLGVAHVEGIVTNRRYLEQILWSDVVQRGDHTTSFLNSFEFDDIGIEVIKPGTQTTVQDYPGRVGYWDIGVPPSGPMDTLAFRLGNKILGNESNAAGLEITLTGPTLKFRCESVFALTGAQLDASIIDANGESRCVEYGKAIAINAGETLKLGKLVGDGMRAYLCVKGGLQYFDYLGSKSTFTLGQFGGQSGRALQLGDVLPIKSTILTGKEQALSQDNFPSLTKQWEVSVLYGPHGAPEFFTPEDIETFFATEWEVHFNSSRTGVRLVGPKPDWARQDGGEAGLHPSNIHDNAYTIGAVDFTGDMPVILGPDGPGLGGVVCPVT